MAFSQTFSSKGSDLTNVVRKHTHELNGAFLDRLAHEIGKRNCRIVCIGEASHGTHEFYHYRAELSKRLIAEHGFDGVCIEGDWPDTWIVNRYVQGSAGPNGPQNADEALSEFRRFPTWMWRNRVVESFVDWLRSHNRLVKTHQQEHRPEHTSPLGAGFYGMDLYSLYTSIDAVVSFLEQSDPPAAERARARFDCFGEGKRGGSRDAQQYGMQAAMGLSRSCESAVLDQLREMQRAHFQRTQEDGDEFFAAQMNALLVKDAESYYRGMFLGEEPSWNLRDQHMANTVNELVRFLEDKKRAAGINTPAKLILWAHNSHLGDARATEMGMERGELNVGQLMREMFGDSTRNLGCYNIGFTSFSGTVTAAHNWDTPGRHMTVNAGRRGSYEEFMHVVGDGTDFGLMIRGDHETEQILRMPRLERAIGVIYRPKTELQSHYFQAYLSRQFDAIMHVDRSHAIEPLDPQEHWTAARIEHLRINPDHVPRSELQNYEPGPRTLKTPFIEQHGHVAPETYPHNY